MKKIITTLLALIVLQTINAQRTIDGLIKAEKDFAAYSVANSTKEAFLKFLDSNGLVFDKGKAVNGIESWTKREKRPGILNWHPQLAEISASGDFGYTTGPWTFQPTINDSVVARGQYTTVWHIDKYGEWKFLVDLGVSNTPVSPATEIKKINITKQSAEATPIPHISPLVAVENDFLKLFAENKSKAYKKYLSKESILNRNGQTPAVTLSDQQLIIDSTSSSIQYTMDGWAISPGQDIGYVYGTIVLNGKTDNYQRIWRKEKTGWKIALEVLRY
jgi:ketosteroid isomerase-like protein